MTGSGEVEWWDWAKASFRAKSDGLSMFNNNNEARRFLTIFEREEKKEKEEVRKGKERSTRWKLARVNWLLIRCFGSHDQATG